MMATQGEKSMCHPAKTTRLPFNGLPLLIFKAGSKTACMLSFMQHTISFFLISDRSQNARPLFPQNPFAFSECPACIMGIREEETPQGNRSFTHTRLAYLFTKAHTLHCPKRTDFIVSLYTTESGYTPSLHCTCFIKERIEREIGLCNVK